MTIPRNPIQLHTAQRDQVRDNRALHELYRQLRLLEQGAPSDNSIGVGVLSLRLSAIYLAVEGVMRDG